MWHIAKAVLTGKIIALNVYVRKAERIVYIRKVGKLNHLKFHSRKLEKEKLIKSKVSRSKEKMQNRTKIMKLNIGNQIDKINENKRFFERIKKKIDKLLAKLETN